MPTASERGIEARRDGKLIVATREDELERLDELERRGAGERRPGAAPARRRGAARGRAPRARDRGPALPGDRRHRLRGRRRRLRRGPPRRPAAGHTGCEVAGLAERPAAAAAIAHSAGATDAARGSSSAPGRWADRLARRRRRRRRPADRPLPRRLPAPAPAPAPPRARQHLSRARSRPSLPRHAPDPDARRRGPARPDGALRRRPGRLQAAHRPRPRPAGEPRLAGTWRLFARHWRPGLTELRHAVSRSAFVAECRRYVPELRDRGRRAERPLRRPRPGSRPRRRASSTTSSSRRPTGRCTSAMPPPPPRPPRSRSLERSPTGSRRLG